MISNSIEGKTKEEFDKERNEIANKLFDYYDDCEIIGLSFNDFKEKSELECLSNSLFLMTKCDVLCLGYDWGKSTFCQLEHKIASEYGVEIMYSWELD